MIPKQIIEEIRNKADIVKIISEYLHIKKRGKNYLGLCPFHAEKDPSFTVSPEKQLFHCFGCNEGGNVFAFIMKTENIGFAEAVEELGTKVGVAVPKTTGRRTNKPEKEKAGQIMNLACKYFQSCLESKPGEAAHTYLNKRGIEKKTQETFHLGYAPPGWDNLFNFLVSRGASPQLIEKTGLVIAREGEKGYYDRFRNRLIFPVIDHRNQVVAFSGRSLGNEEPKYLNSPDTIIYHKGETLFGLNLAKDSIKKCKTAIMVEGNFDLVAPFQAGITNIVAPLGTALTTYQSKLLSRYCETVIIAFDTDSAGGVAAERSLELLRNQGLKVKIAQLIGAKDPDELITSKGKEAFQECLNSSLPHLEFKIKRIAARHNLEDIESRAKCLHEIAGVLSREKDSFVQKEYAKLAAPILKTDLDTILTEIKRNTQYGRTRATSNLRKVTKKPSQKLEEAEKNLIVLAVQNPEVLAQVKDQISAQDFKIPEARKIADLILSADLKENTNPSHFVLDNLSDENTKKFLSRLLLSDHLNFNGETESILKDCIEVIKKDRIKNKIEALKIELKKAEKAGENQKVGELLSILKTEII